MKNIKELRESLSNNYTQVKGKKMPMETAKGLANIANTILKTCKVEMEYNKMTKSKKSIDFLESK